MSFTTARAWAFFCVATVLSPASVADVQARIGSDFKSYDYFDRGSFGGKASISYTKSSSWALRLGGYGLTRFGETSGQANAGLSYWITPTWVMEVDGDVSTYSNILPLFSGSFGTALTIADVLTPALTFQLAKYSDAIAFVFTPAMSWSVVRQIEITVKLFAGITGFINDKSAGTISGSAKLTASPFDYFSLYVGTSIGEEPFYPGDPMMPLSSFFAQHLLAGVKFRISKEFGAELNIDREWRNNGNNIIAGDCALFYDW